MSEFDLLNVRGFNKQVCQNDFNAKILIYYTRLTYLIQPTESTKYTNQLNQLNTPTNYKEISITSNSITPDGTDTVAFWPTFLPSSPLAMGVVTESLPSLKFASLSDTII